MSSYSESFSERYDIINKHYDAIKKYIEWDDEKFITEIARIDKLIKRIDDDTSLLDNADELRDEFESATGVHFYDFKHSLEDARDALDALRHVVRARPNKPSTGNDEKARARMMLFFYDTLHNTGLENATKKVSALANYSILLKTEQIYYSVFYKKGAYPYVDTQKYYERCNQVSKISRWVYIIPAIISSIISIIFNISTTDFTDLRGKALENFIMNIPLIALGVFVLIIIPVFIVAKIVAALRRRAVDKEQDNDRAAFENSRILEGKSLIEESRTRDDGLIAVEGWARAVMSTLDKMRSDLNEAIYSFIPSGFKPSEIAAARRYIGNTTSLSDAVAAARHDDEVRRQEEREHKMFAEITEAIKSLEAERRRSDTIRALLAYNIVETKESIEQLERERTEAIKRLTEELKRL